MNKLESKYSQVCSDLQALNAEIIKLTELKKLLEELGAGQSYPSRMANSRPKRGEPEKAVTAVLSGKGMTNSEVREKLKAKGYPHSLHPIQIAKVLNRLAEKKLIVKKIKGTHAFYSLP